MSSFTYLEPFILIITLICSIPLLGSYIAKIFRGKSTCLSWLETSCYQITGVNSASEMSWTIYLKTLLVFNFLGFLSLFLIQIFQSYLFLNPQHLPAVPWDLAFNTAMGSVTSTGWNSYPQEITFSYLTQMTGLSVQAFLSAGTGMAVLMALIRSFALRNTETIGNFWKDLIRSIIYILLPLSIILALLLVSQGVIQSFSPYLEITTLENDRQILPFGPVASQIAIQQLGSAGGGFFNAESAHPFENPTFLSNFLQVLAILLIPAALVYAYGILIGSKKHGMLLLCVMFFLFLIGLGIALYSGKFHNPSIASTPSLEGIETRIGLVNSLTWATATTATSNGSVNAMLSSRSPLSGGIALFNILLGEIIFGGAGVGLCRMIMFILLTVFLCGLMAGRTPEYLGNKIGRSEMQWVMLAIFTPVAIVLLGTAISCVLPSILDSMKNLGPHGFSEISYAFASVAGNNGSNFSGLESNTLYYNLIFSGVMLMGRLSIIVPTLAVAGTLAKKNVIPLSVGSFSTNSLLFACLLITIILTVSFLSFFSVFSLGPFLEQLLMIQGRTF